MNDRVAPQGCLGQTIHVRMNCRSFWEKKKKNLALAVKKLFEFSCDTYCRKKALSEGGVPNRKLYIVSYIVAVISMSIVSLVYYSTHQTIR